MAAFAAGILTSCEDAPAIPPMQENPQGPVLTTSEMAAVSNIPADINLDQLGMEGTLNLFTISTEEMLDGIKIFPKMQISDVEDFSGSVVDLPVSFENDIVTASALDMHMADLDLFGDDVNANNVYYRLYANIEKDGAEYRFGDTNTYLAKGVMKVSPMVSQMVIETNVVKTPGSYNGWNPDASQYLYNVKLDGEYTGRYVGSILVSGEGFKFFTTDGAWIGCDPENLGNFGDSNIAPTDGDGLYWADVDFDSSTYTLTKVNTVGIIGGMTNWASDVEMTPNEDFTVWSVETNVDGEWKIRMNADWGINYGGALLNPTFDGPNFSTKGNALVTINFAGHHPVIKLKSK